MARPLPDQLCQPKPEGYRPMQTVTTSTKGREAMVFHDRNVMGESIAVGVYL